MAFFWSLHLSGHHHLNASTITTWTLRTPGHHHHHLATTSYLVITIHHHHHLVSRLATRETLVPAARYCPKPAAVATILMTPVQVTTGRPPSEPRTQTQVRLFYIWPLHCNGSLEMACGMAQLTWCSHPRKVSCTSGLSTLRTATDFPFFSMVVTRHPVRTSAGKQSVN